MAKAKTKRKAASKQDGVPGKVIRTFTAPLPCVLTDAEIQERGEELAKTEAELVDHNTEAKRIRSDLKEQEAGFRSTIGRLTITINSRAEERPVEVEVRKLSERLVEEVRLDTGEQITTRPATSEELQGGLFEGDVVVGADGKAGARKASEEEPESTDEEE